ncbi:hypothetical protein ACFLUP_03325 [Chloroflexota bacterium]
MEQNNIKSTGFRIVIIWIAILFLGSFWLSVRGTSDPVSLVISPEVPKQGQPLVATVKLNNPSSHSSVVNYQFFSEGELVKEGITEISAASSKMYQYAYKNPLQLGDQTHFMVRTQSESGNCEKIVSSPPYPPQIFSSFVSFASFSTTLMSSMITMTYYNSTFGDNIGLNLGIVFTVVLLGLLVFLELSSVSSNRSPAAILSRLRLRTNTLTWVLFIIFMGIVYTSVLAILGM